MMQMFRRTGPSKRPSAYALPEGVRIYAIGDVHGRLDLLDRLLEQIVVDNMERGEALTEIVFLGDLIDRGPDSAGVVRRVMELAIPEVAVRALRGNHEAAMLAALDGERDMLSLWLKSGGLAALQSWEVDQAILDKGSLDDVIEAARRAIPVAVRRWCARCPAQLTVGGYHFVHAGVRPGVHLAAQTDKDRLWIRDEFLNSRADHGAIIIHGHSITHEVEEWPNRIGIDTGAFKSGTLTAVGLEEGDRWYLRT